MMSHSVSEDSLQRFVEGATGREENVAIVSHLLRGCAKCAAVLRAALMPETPPDAYDAVFERLQVPPVSRTVLSFKRPAAPAPLPAVRVRLA